MYTFTTLIVGEIIRKGARENVQTKHNIYIKEKKYTRTHNAKGETHIRAIKRFIKMLC